MRFIATASRRDFEIVSGAATALLVAGMFGFLLWSTRQTGDEGPAIQDLVAIEAAVAYRGTPDKIAGASGRKGPTKVDVVEPDPATPPPPPTNVTAATTADSQPTPKQRTLTPEEQYEKLRQEREGGPATDPNSNDENGSGSRSTGQGGGTAMGSPDGWAIADSGHPYMRKFAQAAQDPKLWNYPSILNGSEKAPAFCFTLNNDGMILKVKEHTASGEATLDDAAERAAKGLKVAWNKNPEPFPEDLRKGESEHLICLRYPLGN